MVVETFGHIELIQGMHRIAILKERGHISESIKYYLQTLHSNSLPCSVTSRGGGGSMYTLKKTPRLFYYMPFSPKGYGH